MAWANSLIPTGQFVRDTECHHRPELRDQRVLDRPVQQHCDPEPGPWPPASNLAPWNTGEVTGTGWSAGGVALRPPRRADRDRGRHHDGGCREPDRHHATAVTTAASSMTTP